MPATVVYIVSILHRPKDNCAVCGKPFEIGDKVLSHVANKRKYYHVECRENQFLDL